MINGTMEHKEDAVRNVATALMLTYEKLEAKGSYTDAKLRDECSGEKLKAFGWECRGIDEILIDSVEFYKKSGLLD
ncbi:hypothetical protein ZOSMA_45G00700 [Zostera marina]|uniref:Uncharacterized protein n=1 Tax=Zostera marina TaxID=29655 RepID=A0A0K9P0L6_ZOSMR|nr:hypothetical protein ZOSMA_45G00700 [Zostera marina]